MFVLALQTEIFDTGYCWIVHLSFLTSHNLLFFRFCKTSQITIFSGFLSFSLIKLSKSQSLKLNISRTAWPILMILVSFCRILNGLSDEINLLWRCSSPLSSGSLKVLGSLKVPYRVSQRGLQIWIIQKWHVCHHGCKWRKLQQQKFYLYKENDWLDTVVTVEHVTYLVHMHVLQINWFLIRKLRQACSERERSLFVTTWRDSIEEK